MGNIRHGDTADLVDESGHVVVSGRCSYRKSVSRVGMTSWRGQLSDLVPPFGFAGGAFELRFEDGRSGSVIVDRVNINFPARRRGTTATFIGNGPLPSRRAENDNPHSEGHEDA